MKRLKAEDFFEMVDRATAKALEEASETAAFAKCYSQALQREMQESGLVVPPSSKHWES